MKGFEPKWKDLPDYIIGVTKAIWEDRGVGTLNSYYAADIPVRSPMGITRGNQAVIASTMATINEFPDRELLGEDVIWSGSDDAGYLSSHRLLTKATHTGNGQFGSATDKPCQAYILADCAVKEGVIYDEWLVRDYGGIVRQLGINPRHYAACLIDREGGAQNANPPFTPAADVDGGYHGTGNDNSWGQRYAATLTRIMDHDFAHIRDSYDRAVLGEYAGANRVAGWDGVLAFWVGLRASFSHATFKIHHRIGMDADMMPPRAAIRWSLDGVHDGWGSFGEPTGAPVHVMGMCHAEFGPYGPDGIGLRREFALYDEVAIWKQILMHM